MRKSILGALLILGCNSGGAGGGLGGAGADNSDEPSTGGTASESSGGGDSGPSCVSPEEMNPVGCAEQRPDLGSCVLVARDEDGDGFPGECEVPDRPGVTFLRHPTEPSKAWDCKDNDEDIHPDAWDGPPIPGRPNRCNDDRDNDCSGAADDGEAVYQGKTYTCTCTEDGPLLPCGETPQGQRITFPSGAPVGECKWGARTCDDGRWEECNGAVGPRPETCAQYLAAPNKDYDCDGAPASEELDDPDDGVVDTRVFYCDADGDGRLAVDEESVLTVRACAPPKTGCGPGDAGAWIESPQSSAFVDCDDEDPDVGGLNRKEICDGKDNDCDGDIDDNITFDNQTATFDCVGGTPVILSCPAGKLSCDEDILGNGCETSIDLAHCYDCEASCDFACSAITEECAEVTALALGNEFTCVQLQDGRVSCFGEGSSGQLGDGQSLDSATPVLVLDLQNPQQIKAGGSHMCAIAEDSRVFCWGEGEDGQLSSFGGADLPKPQATFALDLGSPAISLGLGEAHSCAITEDHLLQCWGRGTDGQLGDGGTDSHAPPAEAYKFVDDDYPLFDDAAEVVGGYSHTCARTVDGLVFCAGDSSEGQLGNPSPSGEPYFEPVDELTQVSSIAAGHYHTCAVEDGKVYCWGGNAWGQVGSTGALRYSSPQEVAGISTATIIAAGGNFTCALLADSTVLCWGSNTFDQLGPLGPLGWSASPVAIDGLTDVVEIDAGGDHVCARRSNNQVYCWGRNQTGQLGRGSQSAGSSTPSPPGPLSNSPL